MGDPPQEAGEATRGGAVPPGTTRAVAVLADEGRLAALEETGLLDSPADDTFDRFTRLTRRALGVPVSLVSLVDDHRQFFKSVAGLGEPWATDRETPLSHSFCQHVVTGNSPLVVSDAPADSLVCDNLAIPDLGVIAYAGMPLRTPEGMPLGSLCAIDTQPREWTEDELGMLADLAKAVSSEIGLRLAAVRQRAFAANASHQLRTPLTALRLQLEELGHNVEGRVADGVVDRLLGEVDRLSETVTSLLEMAREGRFGHEREIDLGELVRTVVERWQPLARRMDRRVVAGHVETIQEIVPVAALTQVVEVLVDNALVHGAGTVTLELHDDGARTRLCVRDEGKGLDPASAARIFDRSERGATSKGEGLGLSLADEIARRVGGRLALLPGAPTTFELVLPRR
jgi:signal transduction histidine kinase